MSSLRRHAEPTKSKVKSISASNASKWRRTLALPVWRLTQRSVSISSDAKTRTKFSASRPTSRRPKIANHAEQWLMLIRREIEEHLMPAMRYGPKPTSSARPGSSTVPSQSRSLASIWFRRCGFESPPLHSVVDSGLTWNRRPLSTEPLSRNRDSPTASEASEAAFQASGGAQSAFPAFREKSHGSRCARLPAKRPLDYLGSAGLLWAIQRRQAS